MKKLYFITGSQDLYGSETLAQAESDGREIAQYLNDKLSKVVNIEATSIVRSADEAEAVCIKASADKECVGIILWMHTFSPAKMWIRALQANKKPVLHLHTQYNEKTTFQVKRE